MCRFLFQPCTPGVHEKDAASETYNIVSVNCKIIFEVVVKGYHKCSFAVSLAWLAGTELHLAGRGFVWFVTCQRLPVDFPGWAHFSTRA